MLGLMRDMIRKGNCLDIFDKNGKFNIKSDCARLFEILRQEISKNKSKRIKDKLENTIKKLIYEVSSHNDKLEKQEINQGIYNSLDRAGKAKYTREIKKNNDKIAEESKKNYANF